MARFSVCNLIAFVLLVATAAAPRAALLPNGQSLYRNGEPYAIPATLGPWSRVLYEDDGATYTAGPNAPTRDGRSWKVPAALPASVVVNGAVAPFVRDASVTKTIYYTAGQGELQVTAYPSAVFCRFRYRVKAADKINTLSLRFPNVVGRESGFNLQRNGNWDGRISAKLSTGQPLFIYLLDARERYPRGYNIAGGSLDLYLHTNELAKDTSKDGVPELRAYLTGTFSPMLVPEYVTYLQTDPDIKRAAEEISPEGQASRKVDLNIGIDFWISSESITPAAPLVLLADFSSPIWSKPKAGVADLQLAEQRLLALSQSWLASGARGSLLYGDFQHDPANYYRCRMNDHYFHVLTAWRSVLRTGNPAWYSLARIYGNYYRDSCWIDGWASHGKGLLPTSGPHTITEHWCDAESLLFAYLVDGDYFSLAEYLRWATQAVIYAIPAANNREALVFKRQADVAYWYTADVRWKTISETLEPRIFAELDRIKETDRYKQYGYDIPTGINWQPLWTNRSLELQQQCPDMILNVVEYASHQKLDDVASFIQYGIRPLDGSRIGPGPLGEAHVGLQLERFYEYYRGRPIKAKQRVLYGQAANKYATVFIEKSDDAASQIRVAIGQRQGGDIGQQFAYLTDPTGKRTELTAGIRFPLYRDAPGSTLAKEMLTYIDGWQAAQLVLPFAGPAGRYKLEVGGNLNLLLHGPVSKYPEWQDCSGEYVFTGQDSTGVWPAPGVLVGSN